jgi:transcriptional regulator with XRE-family HTH domain
MFNANAIRLKACRRRAGLDQIELAILTGAPFSTISRLERGHQLPDAKTLLCYELLFDIPAASILPDTTHGLSRFIHERAERLLKRCQRTPDRHHNAKVEFIQSLCERLERPLR